MEQKILICEDDLNSQVLLEKWIQPISTSLRIVSTREEATRLLQTEKFDKVVLDAWLEDGYSLPLLKVISQQDPWVNVIVISADQNVGDDVVGFGFKNQKFLLKPLSRAAIVSGLGFDDLCAKGLSREIADCAAHLGIVTKSSQMLDIFKIIDRVKDSRCHVVIHGESGTGKELLARLIHHSSNRADRGFEAINCAAIPESLLESLLFGVKKGAFTDAKEDRRGLFEICSGGTLFLDEITEMPMSMQSKLLRVIQEQEVRPLGSNKTIKIDTRVLAATNRNLEESCTSGNFRRDLFYRIAVVELNLPPLRERPEDIGELLKAFLREFSCTYGPTACVPTEATLTKLLAYDWPGNVRELRNTIERLILLGEDLVNLPTPHSCSPNFKQLVSAADLENSSLCSMDTFLAQQGERYLRRALEVSGGNVTEAARIAGKHRVAFHRSLKRASINANDFRSNSYARGQGKILSLPV